MSAFQKTLSVVTLIVLIIIGLDWTVGSICGFAYQRSKYGIFHRQNYCMNDCKDDIIILGSSRAAHHYVPSLFVDSLNLSCYNAGSDGMCIFYHYALLASMINNGCCPKIVIYEIMPSDIEQTKGATFNLDAAIDRLAPYYGESTPLDSLIKLKRGYEKLKFYSKTYRYNSKLVQLIKCNFIPFPEDRGYEALLGKLSDEIKPEENKEEEIVLDNDKRHYLYKLIELSRQYQFKLVFVQSPYYRLKHTLGEKAIIELLKEEQVPFIDMLNDSEMLKPVYFRDSGHLNDEGAHTYTSKFISILKSHI